MQLNGTAGKGNERMNESFKNTALKRISLKKLHCVRLKCANIPSTNKDFMGTSWQIATCQDNGQYIFL